MRDGKKGAGEGMRLRFGRGRDKEMQSREGCPSASSGHSQPLQPPATRAGVSITGNRRKQVKGSVCSDSISPSQPQTHECVHAHTSTCAHMAASLFETLIQVQVR